MHKRPRARGTGVARIKALVLAWATVAVVMGLGACAEQGEGASVGQGRDAGTEGQDAGTEGQDAGAEGGDAGSEVGPSDVRPSDLGSNNDVAPQPDTAKPTDVADLPDDLGDADGPLTDVPQMMPECDFYAGPQGGGSDADGSLDRPFGTLEALGARSALPMAGGVVCLLDGDHGSPRLTGVHPDAPLVVRALNPQMATVTGLALTDCRDLTLRGLMVGGPRSVDPAADDRQRFLVTGDVDSVDITLQDLVVQSADSIERWTEDDWRLRSRSGIDLRGQRNAVRGSVIRNTHHALSLRGDHALAEHNLIDNFGGDGIRGLGSHSTYAWNTVRDAYIDEYEVQHDDAFQAYELAGDLAIEGVVIRHNRFLLFADPITDFILDHGLVGTLMQGVIITDGYAVDWVVENNLVVNSQAHGISLFGARGCRVQNNTVVRHPAFAADAGPWIRIADQTKTGQANFDNVLRNNLTTMLTPWDYDPSSTVEGNLEIGDPSAHFIDPQALDFRLRPGSVAVDTGINLDLPETDLDGAPRHVGQAVDLGAFEQQ
jgi:parallel beta-helix repeat protein